jgi:hypothetical protein
MNTRKNFYREGKNESKPDYRHSISVGALNTSITDGNSWKEEATDQFYAFKTVSETRLNRDIKKKIRELKNRHFLNHHSKPDTQSRGVISTALPNQKQQNATIPQKESVNSYLANIELSESKILLSKYPEKLSENAKPKGNLFGFIREGNKLVPITEKPELDKK